MGLPRSSAWGAPAAPWARCCLQEEPKDREKRHRALPGPGEGHTGDGESWKSSTSQMVAGTWLQSGASLSSYTQNAAWMQK